MVAIYGRDRDHLRIPLYDRRKWAILGIYAAQIMLRSKSTCSHQRENGLFKNTMNVTDLGTFIVPI